MVQAIRIHLLQKIKQIDAKTDTDPHNKKFLSDAEIAFANQHLKWTSKDLRVSKKNPLLLKNNKQVLSRSVIKTKEGKLYGIHLGIKHHKELGKGTYAKVKLVQRLTGARQLFALKISDIIVDLDKKAVTNEHAILKKLNRVHSDIIKQGNKWQFIMDLSKGENWLNLCLTEHVKKDSDKMPEVRYLNMFIDVLEHLQYLHNQNILHADLKLANLQYDRINDISDILDFGLSLMLNANKIAVSNKYHFTVTSPQIKKQIKQNQPFINYVITDDVYSVGYAFLEMIGKLPWYIDKKANEYYNKTALTNNRTLITFLESLRDDAAEKRPTLPSAIQFLKQFRNQFLGKVGLLNIADYQKYSSEEKENCITQLKRFKQIYLIHATEQVDNNLYSEIKKELQAHKVEVARDALISPQLSDFTSAALKQVANGENFAWVKVSQKKVHTQTNLFKKPQASLTATERFKLEALKLNRLTI